MREAFVQNFTEYDEVGAAYRDGELVVDLWGGVADPETGRPWQRDTLQLIFSGTKGLIAACVPLLVERGQLDLDAPAARYWPPEELLDARHMAQLLAEREPVTDSRGAFVYTP